MRTRSRAARRGLMQSEESRLPRISLEDACPIALCSRCPDAWEYGWWAAGRRRSRPSRFCSLEIRGSHARYPSMVSTSTMGSFASRLILYAVASKNDRAVRVVRDRPSWRGWISGDTRISGDTKTNSAAVARVQRTKATRTTKIVSAVENLIQHSLPGLNLLFGRLNDLA